MDLFRILIIDDNKARIQQFESVLSFLEYQVFTVSSLEFATVLHGIKDVQAIFIGGGYKKQAALIRQVLDFKLGLPVVLLIDKGTRLQISSAIQKMVTQCIEWPSVSPVFLAQLEKISTPKEPEQLAIINTAKTGLVGNSQGIRQVKELIVQSREYQDVEKNYIALTSDITLERAYADGFIEEKNSVFAVRGGVLASRE